MPQNSEVALVVMEYRYYGCSNVSDSLTSDIRQDISLHQMAAEHVHVARSLFQHLVADRSSFLKKALVSTAMQPTLPTATPSPKERTR